MRYYLLSVIVCITSLNLFAHDESMMKNDVMTDDGMSSKQNYIMKKRGCAHNNRMKKKGRMMKKKKAHTLIDHH